MVANPAGYILNRSQATATGNLVLENAKFDRDLLVEVATIG